MALVNPPLMNDWALQKAGIEQSNAEEITYMIGTKDPSYPFFEQLNEVKNEAVRFTLPEGADHHFTGQDENFFKIPEYFLFDKEEALD